MVAICNPSTQTLATVAKFIGYISSRNYQPLAGFFAPNATWFTLGSTAFPNDTGGAVPATQYLATLPNAAVFDSYEIDIQNTVVEGYMANVEVRITGDLGELHWVNNASYTFHLDSDFKITLLDFYTDRIAVNYLVQWLADHPTNSVSFEPVPLPVLRASSFPFFFFFSLQNPPDAHCSLDSSRHGPWPRLTSDHCRPHPPAQLVVKVMHIWTPSRF